MVKRHQEAKDHLRDNSRLDHLMKSAAMADAEYWRPRRCIHSILPSSDKETIRDRPGREGTKLNGRTPVPLDRKEISLGRVHSERSRGTSKRAVVWLWVAKGESAHLGVGHDLWSGRKSGKKRLCVAHLTARVP